MAFKTFGPFETSRQGFPNLAFTGTNFKATTVLSGGANLSALTLRLVAKGVKVLAILSFAPGGGAAGSPSPFKVVNRRVYRAEGIFIFGTTNRTHNNFFQQAQDASTGLAIYGSSKGFHEATHLRVSQDQINGSLSFSGVCVHPKLPKQGNYMSEKHSYFSTRNETRWEVL